jgi:transposase
MSKSTRYDDEFKKMILELHKSGKPLSEITREYGVSNATIYKWKSLYSPIQTNNGEVTNNDEIRKLKKKMLQLQEENEILKKAIAIFTKK